MAKRLVSSTTLLYVLLLLPFLPALTSCDIFGREDPPTLELGSATYTINEDGASLTVSVTLSGDFGGTVGVRYASADGTAASGSDFTATSGTLSWSAGDTAGKTFTVAIADDALEEGDETFTVALSDPSGGAALGNVASAVATIVDNDPAATLQFGSASYAVDEDGANLTVAVTMSGGSSATVGVSYATAGGTAVSGSDFSSTSGALSWSSGDTADKTFTVTIADDALEEGDETFTVTLTDPSGGAALGSTVTATVTIHDDESMAIEDVTISVSPYFDPSTAGLGDIVTLVVPLENDGAVGHAFAYPVNDVSGDPIESVPLTYDGGCEAWTGTVTIGQYYPTSITFNQISVYDDEYTEHRSFFPGTGYPEARTLTITGTTPDTTGPELVSVVFEPASAAVGQTVYVYAVFGDAESGIKPNWGATIHLTDATDSFELDVSWRYDSNEERYYGSFAVTDAFPSETLVADLWAKNGVGITAWLYENDDFVSPVLTKE